MIWACCSSPAPTSLVFWSLANAAADGSLALGPARRVRPGCGRHVSMIAFGGLNWALDGAAAPVAAVLRLEPAMAPAGDAAHREHAASRRACRRARSGSATSTSATPKPAAPCPRGLRPDHPGGLVAGHRRPERRGQDHAGQAALPPVRPAGRRHRGRRRRPARDRPRRAGASGVTAVFQDFIRFELPLRDNVAPARRARRRDPRRARRRRAPTTWPTSTRPRARATTGGTDLSGGQWQRIAWPERCARCSTGAGLVLLDEPTAQLDVRGEAEIFERILAATRHVTTILVSHRFSTVRQADRICVLEHGRVDRARHPRRADRAGRPLPHHVRPAGPALRRRREDEEGVAYDVLADAHDVAARPVATTCRRRWRRCGGWCKLGYRHEPALLLAAFAAGDALRAARCAARAVAEAARRRCPRTPSGPCARRRRRPRRVGRRPPGSCAPISTTRPAPLPRQGHDRARVARRPPAGVGRRPSRTRSAPTTSTGSRCCATRSSSWTTCTCRCSRPAAGSCGSASRSRCWPRSIRRWSCSPCSRCRRCSTSTWRPGVERAAEERGASRNRLAKHLFITGHHRAARQGGPRHRHRRAPGHATPRRVGALVSARCRAHAGAARVWHTLAWAVFGGAYVGAIVFVAVRARRAAGDVLLVLAAGSRLSAVHRRDRRRDRLPARHLAGRLAAPRLARGLRRLARRRTPTCPSPDRLHRRHPPRARLVRLPRHRRASCSTT